MEKLKSDSNNAGTINSLNPKGWHNLVFILLFTCLFFIYADPLFSQQRYTWTGSVSQVFNLPENWLPSGIPGQSDTIILNSGTINIATGNPVLLGGIYLTKGNITATDNIIFSGNMYWSEGTWSGTGTLTCPVNSFLFIRGTSTKILSQAVLKNEGKISWEGSGTLSLINGANLKNYGLFEINNNSSLSQGSGNQTYFNNLSSGIIRKYSDKKTIFGVTLNFINDGLFEVLNGSLEIRSNGTFSGTLEIKNGSPLLLNSGGGKITWTSSSLLKTNGEVILSGNYEFEGTYDVLKKTTVSLNTSDFTGTVINLGDTLNISAGNINFLSADITIPVIQMPSGSLGGTAAVQTTRVFNWSGGNIIGTGSVNVPANARMNITGDLNKNIGNRTINNLGTISWEGTGKIYISGGAVINNSGLFEIKNNSSINHAAGTPSIPTHLNNLPSGIIRKNSDGKTILGQTVGLYFDNQGLIDLQKGTLSLGATASYTGNFHSEKNTLVSIETGTHDFNPGINLDIEGSLSIIAGITRFNSDSVSLPNTSMTGGELGGSGIINVSDTMIWSGGSIIDTSYLKVDTGGVLILSGTNRKTVQKRKILNNGHTFIYGGELLLFPYSIIKNQGEFLIEGPFNGITASGGGTAPEFRNLDNGKFLVNASNGPVNCAAFNYINSGYWEINNGVFNIGKSLGLGQYTQLKGTTKLNSGEFVALREILIKGGLVNGTGRINGSIFNSGVFDPGIDANMPGGLSVSGQYKQATSGVLQIDIGGRSPVSGYDQLTTGNAVLSGELRINYIMNYVPVPEDKFRVVRWLNQPNNGTFDTISNIRYGEGQILEAEYTKSSLLLKGNLARKDIWLQVIGPKNISPGQAAKVKILYGNESADTVVFPMLIEFKNIDDFSLLFDYVHFPYWIPWADPAAVTAYPDLVKEYFLNGKTGSIPLILTIPGRKQDDALPKYHQLDLSLHPSCKSAGITASIGDPLSPEIEGCLRDIGKEIIGVLPGGACVKAVTKIVMGGMETYLNGTPVTLGGWIASNGWAVAKCAISFVPGMSLVTKTADILDKIITGIGRAELALGCGAALLPQEGGESAQASFKCVTSTDPNEKTGPDGYNSLRYVKGNNPLAYAVFFENVDTATAPAQKVIIKDTLNPKHWDFSTFSFTSIDIGDTTVYPPAWEHNFYMEVDLRPENNIIAGITGTLDDLTGVITWEFASLDPVTHNPTTDPLAGFLPPNITPPRGQGNVIYILQPNLDLPSGTGIGSFATIVFDNNEPMATKIWENHLDRTPPVSSMINIDEIQTSNLVKLKWTGYDAHSGIRKYFLNVSVIDRPFIEWLSTSDTSCTFQGDTCSHYKFYIVALDSAGNREQSKSPELQVLINPFIQPVLQAVGTTEICQGDSVMLRTVAGINIVYEWYRNNQILQDAHDSIYYAKLSGYYSVIVGTSETCSGESKHIAIAVNTLPEIVITATINLLETSSGEASYQWYFNSNAIAGATGSTYLAETSGDYRVQVTGINGCSGLSEVYQHMVTDVQSHFFDHFLVYPNPSHDKLNVRSPNNWTGKFSIRIIDMKGCVLYIHKSEGTKEDQNTQIDLSQLAPGVYNLQMTHDKDIKFIKFTKN